MDHSKTEHSLIELIPSGQLRNSLFLLHIYSSPRDMRQRFSSRISKAVRKAAGCPLVVAGDFNAPHHEWGYHRVTAKGANLWRAASDYGLTLVTDPSFPTRIGNSCSRDTTPDLTFVANVGNAAWCNLNETLGSDHCVLATSLVVRKRSPKEFTITDWDILSKLREEREAEKPTSLDSWVAQLKEDVQSATKSVATDMNVDRMDSRLAHLLEAKGALLARWKGQRLNRRLRKKIAELNRTIEMHCQMLSKQQWNEICNSVDRQMRTGGKWNLLKHLIKESNSRTNQRRATDKILHLARQDNSDTAILESLAKRYLPLATAHDVVYPPYKGPPMATLDEPFGVPEVKEVLEGLNGRSAPGPDGISNRLLRNLDDESIAFLTDEINRFGRRVRFQNRGSWRRSS